MKRIVLIIPSGGVGGIERLALNFYNLYKSKGFEVKVVKIIKLKTDIVNFGEDELCLSDIDFSEMGRFERMFFYVKAPWRLRQIIKKYKFTHSLGFGDMPNIFSSLTFTKEYKIVSLHALKSVEFVNNSFLSRLSKLSYRTSYYFLDKVVCISKAIQEDLIQNCQFAFPKKLEVIYNPHNIAEIEKLSQIPLEDSAEKEIFKKKTVLFLGRLTYQKSPWHLIKSFSLLKECKDVNLVFVGDGVPAVEANMNKLIQHYNLQDNVFFLGRKSNPYQYLSQATLLALSSYYEGTPNVIVEAIACEIPIVSSNCTNGIIELMSNNQLETQGQLIKTESGIITPNFFKNSLSIPQSDDYIDEEYAFAEALYLVLNDNSYKASVVKNKADLLGKYDLEKVAFAYLKENK